jgi:Na+/phosphate symporter
MYISEVKDDIENFEFSIPEFFNKEKFKINKELIKNKLTREVIEESEKLEYVFKVILGSMNKKKKKPIGIFSQNTVDIFNRFVDKIDQMIDNHLGKIREIEISKAGLVDFGEFLDIKYDVDGAGDVYPEVWDDMQNTREEKKKSKTNTLTKK